MPDKLSRVEILDELTEHHGFAAHDVFLLPLVPLVEMVLVDGAAQQAEMEILTDYAAQLLDCLKEQAQGVEVVHPEQATRFLNRLFAIGSDHARLKRLRKLCLRLIQLNSDRQWVMGQEQTLLEYCLDIAAASVLEYPYAARGRIVEQEKLLLADLVRSLSYTGRQVRPGLD